MLNEYDPAVSHDREKNHGEVSCIYFLYGTRPPYFNPITLDHPGIESKFTGWFLWKYRVKGIAYYQLNNYAHNYIEIEGVNFVNDEPTTPTASYIVRTKAVTVSDGKLTMVMGVMANDEYTMPNYLDIEAVAPPLPVRNLRIIQVQ